MSKPTKHFPFPSDLVAAQRAYQEAAAKRTTFITAAPRWVEPQADIETKSGTVLPGGPGWSDAQREEGRLLLEAEQAASQAVWAHPFWMKLHGADRVEARTQLKHLPAEWAPPADEEAAED
ncbi:hypothetical protein [Kitasatospora sp. NPDC088783]|uniref:hypothetical protein n=1 Tax=Kitasatospora sp. NPDC088783 TaxID=3364077 RepID=UPI00381292BB